MRETLLNCTAVLPSLVAVTVCGGLLVPTFWLPKFRLLGESFMAVPAPSSSIYCGFDDALSINVTNPVSEPVVVG